MSKDVMQFPDGFVWGAATSSYQIEGAFEADGKGASVWDMFCLKTGAVYQNENGNVACDHYHLYPQDVALMQEMGLQAYRFSISWPRVLPDGVGKVNEAGLGFYDRLVDALLAAGIEPYGTLFHWDFPYELYCRGGWLNRDSVDWFADYAQVVVSCLGDRVKNWMTLNEPNVFIELGYLKGEHAPGDKLGFAQVLRAGHHALLAHGKATQAIRSSSPGPCKVGIAPTIAPGIPESPDDLEAARIATFAMHRKSLWPVTWWLDPVFLGHYPQDGLEKFGADMSFIKPGDMELIQEPQDFLGINIYHGPQIRQDAQGVPEPVLPASGSPRTALGWPVTPDALYWGPRFLWERYAAPIFITENGLGNLDWVSLDGKVHDPQRIEFSTRYLLALRRAIADGAQVIGYFHWSLMDNFEWAYGYNQRFGLIHVDYVTQKRVLKDSAYWYRKVIVANGGCLGE